MPSSSRPVFPEPILTWSSSRPTHSRRAGWRLFTRLILALSAGVLLPETTSAAEGDFLRAVLEAPSVAQARARAEAESGRRGSAGLLPDPELELMASQARSPHETMPMLEATLSQPLPRSGERDAARDAAEARTRMAEADLLVEAGELAAMVASAIAESEAAVERARLLDELASRLDAVGAALHARLGTGAAGLPAVLTAQTRASSARTRAASEQSMSEQAALEARALLGLDLATPLPSWEAPESTEILVGDTPVRRLALARVDESRSMVRMARASTRPRTAVGVRYQYESERMGATNTLGVVFMTELPWRSRHSARAEEKAARIEGGGALLQAQASERAASVALERVAARARRLAEIRGLASAAVARAAAEERALLEAAGVSTSEMMPAAASIAEAVERSVEARMDVVNAEEELRRARSELWRHRLLTPLARPAGGHGQISNP